ncbi:MAG: N-acetyl sugar amidotransferase [Candidatus Rokubacteria bacterium]|nr:N-acetyl sugar amidotransferase [Candidatus Rokubacteria bacterium]
MSKAPGKILNDLRRCVRCLLPETHETILFDREGVCNVCRQIEDKKAKVDWAAKEREFVQLLDAYRGGHSYDCIVPFSGGKDSTFTLYHLVTHHKLKPLVVTFDHGFMRPRTLENNDRTLKKLGVDYLKFRPNWKVVQKLMLESLKRKGDFCWHCHTGIFSYPMHIAVKFKIPLVIWGEPSAEYTSYYGYGEQQEEEVDERRFNRFVNLGITAEDMVGMLDGTVTERDLEPFTYPRPSDLRAINCRSICLGSYMPWDVKTQVQVIKRELGWQENDVEGVPPAYGYEKIECAMQGVRDYLRFIKRGYGRTNHLAAIDLRNGRITPEDAAALIEKHDGKRPASLDVFLEYVNLTEDDFMAIALKHVVAPHVHDSRQVTKGEPLWDQARWDVSK